MAIQTFTTPSASTAVTFRDILLDKQRGTFYLAGKIDGTDYYEKRWLNGSLIWKSEFPFCNAVDVAEAAIDFASGDLISTGHCHRSPPEGGIGESFFIRRLFSSSGNTSYDKIYRVSSASDTAEDYTSNILIDNARDRIYLGGEAGGALMVTAVQLSTGFLYRNDTLLMPGFKEIGDLLFSADNSIIYLSAVTSDNNVWTGQILLTAPIMAISGSFTGIQFAAADAYSTRGKSALAYPYIYHSFYSPYPCNSIIFRQNVQTLQMQFQISLSECLTTVVYHAPSNTVLAAGYDFNGAFVKSWIVNSLLSTPQITYLPNLDVIQDAEFFGSSTSLFFASENSFGNLTGLITSSQSAVSLPSTNSVLSTSVVATSRSRSVASSKISLSIPSSAVFNSNLAVSHSTWMELSSFSSAILSTPASELHSSASGSFLWSGKNNSPLTSSVTIKRANPVISSSMTSNAEHTFSQFLEKSSRNPQLLAISAAVIFIALSVIFLIGFKCGDRFRFNEKDRRYSSSST